MDAWVTTSPLDARCRYRVTGAVRIVRGLSVRAPIEPGDHDDDRPTGARVFARLGAVDSDCSKRTFDMDWLCKT